MIGIANKKASDTQSDCRKGKTKSRNRLYDYSMDRKGGGQLASYMTMVKYTSTFMGMIWRSGQSPPEVPTGALICTNQQTNTQSDTHTNAKADPNSNTDTGIKP